MDLARLEGLLIHGHRDDILPLRWAQRAAAQLHALGIAHSLWTHEAGHELTDGVQRAFQTWFADRKRAWNGTSTE
jgi:phospholipase/carboxylesterase